MARTVRGRAAVRVALFGGVGLLVGLPSCAAAIGSGASYGESPAPLTEAIILFGLAIFLSSPLAFLVAILMGVLARGEPDASDTPESRAEVWRMARKGILVVLTPFVLWASAAALSNAIQAGASTGLLVGVGLLLGVALVGVVVWRYLRRS